MFDHHVLDMVELGVEKYTSMFDIKVLLILIILSMKIELLICF